MGFPQKSLLYPSFKSLRWGDDYEKKGGFREMNAGRASRVYTEQSIKSWTEKLEIKWESFFSEEELRLGRRFYKENVVRQFEIKPLYATINGKIERESFYAIIEVKDENFDIRISTPKTLMGRALAVSGLYEIEELVADNCDTIKEQASSPLPVVEAVKQVKVETPAKNLCLSFSAVPAGLFFQAYWADENGNQEGIASIDGRKQLHPHEREQLIRLVHLAKESSFVFIKGGAILNEIGHIPLFLERKLDLWKKCFKIECDHSVDFLKGDIKEADIEVAVQENGDQWDVSYELKVNGTTLSSDEKKHLIQKRDGLAILPHVGIVRVSQDKKNTIDEMALPFDRSQQPKYMLFSLFEKRNIRLSLNPEVELWKNQILNLPTFECPRNSLLRPYQNQGIAWMKHLLSHGCGVLLADEMGLGKTLQILALLASEEQHKPNLIVCPASVIPVWQQEITRFYPALQYRVVTTETMQEPKGNVTWLCSYTQLRQHKDRLLQMQFEYAALDEAQFIKNPDTKVAQTCMGIKADRRIAITGTPLENRYMDVWTIFRFLMPGLLGSKQSFAIKSATPEFLPTLTKQITPFILRRAKTDVLPDLPDKTEIDIICPLTDLQRELYQQIAQLAIEKYGENLQKAVQESPIKLFAILTRLRQVCCDPNLLPWVQTDSIQSGKINVLFDRLQECFANGKKVVIFSQFVSLLKNIQKHFTQTFPQVPMFELFGHTLDRRKPVADFQNTKGVAIITVSLKAGGTGITLHAADTVFLLDPWWNPASENQAIDRVHRIGQSKNVFIYRLLTPGTIEEKIQNLKSNKKFLFSQIIGNIKNTSIPANYLLSLSELIKLT